MSFDEETIARIKKLPVWARNIIARQEQEITRTKRVSDLQHATGAELEGCAYTDEYDQSDDRIVIPRYTDVAFQLGVTRNDIIRCRVKDGKLYVNGRDSIVIEPSVSNAIEISLKDRS